MTDTSITGIAGEVSTVDEMIMKFMPFISIGLGLIPGGSIAAPLVSEILTVVDEAAKAVAAGNSGAAFSVVLSEVMNHLTPGKPNSPILSAAPIPNESDPSAVGSG